MNDSRRLLDPHDLWTMGEENYFTSEQFANQLHNFLKLFPPKMFSVIQVASLNKSVVIRDNCRVYFAHIYQEIILRH